MVSAIGLLVVGLIPDFFAAGVAMTLLGLGDSIRRSLNMAMILEVSEEAYRGRVSSVYAMNFGLMPLGVLPASVIAQYFGPQAAASALAVLLLVICLIVLMTQKRLRSVM